MVSRNGERRYVNNNKIYNTLIDRLGIGTKYVGGSDPGTEFGYFPTDETDFHQLRIKHKKS